MPLKKLTVEFDSDTSGFDAGLRRIKGGISNLQSSAGALNKGFGFMNITAGITAMAAELMASVGALVVVTKAVYNFASECIGLASDLNEVENVINVTFGDGASAITISQRNLPLHSE